MYILGLGGSDHDVSAALLENDRIVCAIEEERVSRMKYGLGGNLLLGQARRHVLSEARLRLDQVDMVVVDDILPKTATFTVRGHNVHLVNHHLLHAASAFYPSPFEAAAILIVDGAGSLIEYRGKRGIECLTYAYGTGNTIHTLDKIIGEKYHIAPLGYSTPYQKGDPDNSLGYFYRLISHYCGFNYVNTEHFFFTEDGKTMGLAPYGSDAYWPLIRPFVDLLDEGQIRIDLRSGEFEQVLESIVRESLGAEDDLTRRADLAWAGQKVLEEALVHAARYLYTKTQCPYLCIAGGVGLNSVANGKILVDTPFEEIFVQPASGDGGTSLGAALWGYYGIQGHERKSTDRLIMRNAYLGREYREDEIMEALRQFPSIQWELLEDLPATTARLIVDGKIVGMFQGGSEFGPRALGHRSILANPMLPGMKDHLNNRVKFREPFRPFAPAVLFEHQADYFEIRQYTPFMLIVAEVKPEKRFAIPAVTHVDGTARVQSVSKEDHGVFYDVIHAFYEITGVPIVLNTSFNVKGEPIVESPVDALKCFLGTGIDNLVLGPYLVNKSPGSDEAI